MKVAIVGNAEPKQDYSSEILACDRIIRFSHVRSRGPWTGERTDVYAIQHSDKKIMQGYAPVREFDDLWIHSWVASNEHFHIKTLRILRNNRWLNRPFRLLFQEPLNLTMLNGLCASTGLVVLEYLRRFPKAFLGTTEARLKLFCFTWEGSPAHHWAAEKHHCQQLADAGVIDIAV